MGVLQPAAVSRLVASIMLLCALRAWPQNPAGTTGSGASPTPSSTADAKPGSQASSDAGLEQLGHLPNGLVRVRDLLAPVSSIGWGPFTVHSAQIMGAVSNTSLFGGLGQLSPLPVAGTGRDTMMAAEANLGYFRRMGRGALNIEYRPMFFRQNSYDLTQMNQDLSARFYREIGPNWRLDLGSHAGAYNQYSFLLHEPVLEPVVRLRVPFTNQDLLDIIDTPQVFRAPQSEFLLTGRQTAAGNVSFSLTRRLGPRNHLVVRSGYTLNRSLDADTPQGVLVDDYRSSGRTHTVTFEHSLSPRQEVGVQLSDAHLYSRRGGSSEQRAQFTWKWLPAPRWSLSLAAGPAVRNDGLHGRQPDAAVDAVVARHGNRNLVSAAWSRGMYFGIFPGGRQSDRVEVSWLRNQRTQHIYYGVTGGYQRLSGGTDRGLETRGWLVRPTIMVPVSRTMYLMAQYIFFNQNWGAAAPNAGLQDFHRHILLVGLRWSFDVEGRSRLDSGPVVRRSN